MKREIKFRAWLTELEQLIPAEQVLGFVSEPIDEKMTHDRILQYSNLPLKGGYCVERENSEYYVLMQYTGIKDKTGKEIYEGDILKVDNNETIDMWMRGEVGEVKFIPSRFTLCLKNDDKKMLTEDFEDCVTVIGNVFENHELLKK